MTTRRDTGRMQPSVAVMLALLGLACLVFVTRGCTAVGFHHLGWGNTWLAGPLYGLFGTGILIQLGLAVWVGLDAHRRGSNGWLWGLLVALTPVVGLVVYLIVLTSGVLHPTTDDGAPVASAAAVTPPPASADGGTCPHCARGVDAEFRVCPYCGGPLGCSECGRPLAPDWRVCPFCGTSTGGDRG